jgi:prevent-host-death family protein
MDDVKLTELRQKLPPYLKEVEKGRALRITSGGRVVARLLPPEDTVEAARARLQAKTHLPRDCGTADSDETHDAGPPKHGRD